MIYDRNMVDGKMVGVLKIQDFMGDAKQKRLRTSPLDSLPKIIHLAKIVLISPLMETDKSCVDIYNLLL